MPTGHVLLAESSGPQAVTRRFGEAFSAMAARAGADFEAVPQETWEVVRECGPRWLETHPQGAVLRVSTTLSRLGELLGIAGDAGCAALLRAGNAAGILMAPNRDSASRVLRALRQSGVHGRLEAASDATKASIAQWDASGNELELMRRIKADFDPLLLLNRGRLYGVI